MKEKSLVVFTLLGQMAAGAFVVLFTMQSSLFATSGSPELHRRLAFALLAMAPLMAFSMLISLLHLGKPHNAWRALARLATSWLSREILFTMSFSAAWFFYALLEWFAVGSSAFRITIGALTSLLGLSLIYSMSRVYLLSASPGWNSWTTPLSFFAAALLLGSLAAGIALIATDPLQMTARLASQIGIIAILSITAEFLTFPSTSHRLAASGGNQTTARRDLLPIRLLRARLWLALPAAISIVLFTLWPVANRPWLIFLMLLALGLALASESFGRLVFYESRGEKL